MGNLEIGKTYLVENKYSGKKSKQERIKKMEYLGEFANVYLFRHKHGYKEAFMKKEMGLNFKVFDERKEEIKNA